MKALLHKVIIWLIACAMLAVSAGVLVVSAAFAVFALLRGSLGAPGAAAVTALAAAALMAVVAGALEAWTHGRRPRPQEDKDLVQRLLELGMERPVTAMAALIGAAALAMRNPALVAIVVKAILDPKPKKKA